MAEILVLAREDAPSYDPGDIIMVRPDGWKWGKKEGPPLFKVIRVPGVAVEELQHLQGPLMGMEEAIIEVQSDSEELSPTEFPDVIIDEKTKPVHLARYRDFTVSPDPPLTQRWRVQKVAMKKKRQFSLGIQGIKHGALMSKKKLLSAIVDKSKATR